MTHHPNYREQIPILFKRALIMSESKKMLWLRSFAKRIPYTRAVVLWFRSFLSDLLLLILTLVGYVPLHWFRKLMYRFAGIKIAKHTAFHWRARFFHPKGIAIGSYTNIGNDAFLDGRLGLNIGDCVNISGDVRIYTVEHDIDDPWFHSKGGPVNIEDYVYIGSRVTILPGVRLGYGSVVASGAVVTKDVPPYMLVGGVPAKVLRERSRDLRYKLGNGKHFQ